MKVSTVFRFCFCCLRLQLAIELSAADPTGFVSLDCGYNGSAYTDSSTGLTWKPDSRVFDPTGNSFDSSILAVAPPFSDSPNYFRSVRYFTGNRTKYCYVFDEDNAGVAVGSAYLVRASFWAGQYVISPPPARTKRSNASRVFFRIFINADTWDDVLIDVGSPQALSPVVKEMYVVANYSSEIAVCLGGPGIPGLDSPFISSLELRLLDSRMDVVGTMAATSSHLFKLHLIDFGSNSTTPIRYPKDNYDRIWTANGEQPILSTTAAVSNGLCADPPTEVMQTARITAPDGIGFNATLGIRGNGLIKSAGVRSYSCYLYMAEISPNVTSIGQRVFDISIFDGYSYSTNLRGYDILNSTRNRSFTAAGLYGGSLTADAYLQGSLIISFVKSSGAVFGPLLSGLELLLRSETTASPGTIAVEVNALDAIKASFGGSLVSWQGDPCLPYPYNWISCSITGNHATIISLFLANQNLTGEIPSSIGDLTSLSSLDLQGNKLSGSIPAFLATLPNLNLLLLQNNNLSGVIPATLLEKQASGRLKINVDGNPALCNATCTPRLMPPNSSSSTPKHVQNLKYIISGILGGIFGIVVVVICLLALWGKRSRRKTHVPSQPNPPIIPNPNRPRSFSYSEVQIITSNFCRILGKGGFGTVFHGVLDNMNQVAVQILSTRSTQGIEEFLNEVNLLSRVHHRNLVGLHGYCIEHQVMLIYEYMSQGSLEKLIHGTNVPPNNNPLSWRNRLKILVNASEGINYLHNGCRPRIIHRDVKSANILINEDMEAKISDFGISRSNYEHDSNIVSTVKGSTAYMAPEYIRYGQINEKVDVYAFGVVVLEVIS